MVIWQAPKRIAIHVHTSERVFSCFAGSHVSVTRQGWSREGFSPLHESAYGGHEAMCRLLCECGADRNLRDFYGKSALHLACESGHLGTASVLLRYGANPVLQDLAGCTPLIYAVRDGAVELVQDIIARGYSLDSVGQSKRTALHIAAGNGFELIVRLLLEAGARFNTRDQCHWTPLEHALAGDHVWCVFYLLQHGHSLPAQDIPLDLLNNMVSKSLASLAVLLLLGWRPAGTQLDHIKIALSQQDVSSVTEADMRTRRIVEKELRNPSGLLRLSCNKVVDLLAQHTGHKTIMDNIFELEVPSDVTNALSLADLQQFVFLVG